MNRVLYGIISKKKQISPHIFEVAFDIGVFIISIWVVEKDGVYFLIDTGIGSMAKYLVERYLDQRTIQAFFLTHGHSDHIGGLPALKDLLPDLPVIIDRRELPYVTGQVPYPRRKKIEAKIFDEKFFTFLEGAEAETLLKQAGLLPVFAPGHSPGHTCYYHKEDNVLLAGDMLTTNRFGRLRPPMKAFTADMDQALKTAHNVLTQYPHVLLSVCHGGEIREPLKELENSSWCQTK
ncbi:MBL fold metallo-hydrolase [Streptococcus dentapri]|uniref:MBL fold metallo-hydrolase n=1 Tax=Streptococcus dentapri TaxID=573564 RepID=A0ABV8D2U1_9STRE